MVKACAGLSALSVLALLLPLRLNAQPAPQPSANQQLIEPKAVDVLKTACATLEAAKAMSFNAVNTYGKAARNGQPLD